MEIIYKKQKFTSTIDKTLAEVLYFAQVKEDRLCVFINGQYPQQLDLNRIISKDDVVFIYAELSGRQGLKIGANVALLAATIAAGGIGAPGSAGFLYTASSVGGQVALRTAILIAGVAVATGLQSFASKSISDINGSRNVESPTFSLTNSGNAFRPFQPFPIVFGRHNIFPDFSAVPYNEYEIYDPTYLYDSTGWFGTTLYTENGLSGFPFSIVRNSVTFNLKAPDIMIPTTGHDLWYRYEPAGIGHYYDNELDAQQDPPPIVGDKYRRLYVYVDTASDISFNGRWVLWNDIDQNGISANFSAVMSTFANVQNFEFQQVAMTYPRKTEVVKQIMNFGWGDLVYLDDRIGTTAASDYRQYKDSQNTPAIALVQTPTNWIIPQGEPTFDVTLFGPDLVIKFNLVNGNVDTVDGGRMDNVPTFAFPDNWVIRQGPEKVFALQVDIEGRQFALDKVNGGTSILTRYFDIEYRQVLPVVGAWIAFPNSMNYGNASSPLPFLPPYHITHGSSGDIWRDTLWIDNLSPGQYEIRGRRRDPNEDSADNVSEIYLKRARFYQLDESQSYLAQNRKAVIVESDSQLNGALGKLSSLIFAKTWRNNGDGSFTWNTTTNPADWFLYYIRGGFKNPSADGSLTYPYSPTIGWLNSADHPDNGEHIFGLGTHDSEIDFASITDWWNFCNDNNIEFAAVLDRTENVFETFKKICSVGRASPTWALGKIGVVFERPNELPVAMFTPENILTDSFEMTYITEDLPDEVIVNYMNEANNWQQDSVRAVAIGVTDPINTVTFDFWGITNTSLAQRQANLLIASQTYRRRVCKFSVDAEGLIIIRGDVILLSYELFNWDYSSRFISTENDGVNLTRITMECEINDTVSHVSIRLPNGNLAAYAATIVSNVITLTDPFPLSNAPFYLDQNQTENPASIFAQSVPEDFLIIAGNRPTPGRTMRIVAVNPKGPNEFEIECTEEDPGFYAQEYSLSGLPLPIKYERVKASVTTANVALKGQGKATVFWTLDGAAAVSILLSLNGSPPFLYTIGGATHFGDEIELAYSTGDVVTALITPIYVDLPFSVETKTITFTLD